MGRKNAMLLFGLTGGIASGKSTVARIFAERGVPVVDADRIARDVVLPGSPTLAALIATFGPTILGPDGNLDRKELARLAFADGEKTRAMNAIVHPAIAEASRAAFAALAAAGTKIACYDAALIVENGLTEAFRPLVVVTAPEGTQLARATARDNADPAEVRQRMAAQLPLASKAKVADYVIANDGTLDELRTKANGVLDRIAATVGVQPSSR